LTIWKLENFSMKLGDCNASRLPKADAALVMDVMNALFEFIEASVKPRRASDQTHQSGTRLVRFFGDNTASTELLSLVKRRDMRELLSQLLKLIKSPELHTGLILNALSKLFPGEQTCADIILVADSTASHICVPLWLGSTPLLCSSGSVTIFLLWMPVIYQMLCGVWPMWCPLTGLQSFPPMLQKLLCRIAYNYPAWGNQKKKERQSLNMMINAGVLEGLEGKIQGEAAPKLTKELLARTAELLTNQIQVCVTEASQCLACQHGGICLNGLAEILSENGFPDC